MHIIPVINCPDRACAEKKIAVAKRFLNDGELVHFDATDGVFTTYKTWNSPAEWADMRAPFGLEVHLMVEHPERQVESWLAAGAKRVIVHVETINEKSLEDIMQKAKLWNASVMLSESPETPVEDLLLYRDRINQFQILSVYPGPAAQDFLPLSLDKIRLLRRLIPNATIEVDGGINAKTAVEVKRAGANAVVSASYIFGNIDPKAAYNALRII